MSRYEGYWDSTWEFSILCGTIICGLFHNLGILMLSYEESKLNYGMPNLTFTLCRWEGSRRVPNWMSPNRTIPNHTFPTGYFPTMPNPNQKFPIEYLIINRMNPLEVKQPTPKHLTMQQQSRPLKYTDKSRWPTQNQNMNYPKPKTTLKVGIDACDVQSTHAIRLFGSYNWSLTVWPRSVHCCNCTVRGGHTLNREWVWKTNFKFNSFFGWELSSWKYSCVGK